MWILWYNVPMIQKEGSSVEVNINSELTPEQEAKLDHIVDTTGCSYDDARRLMGLPVEDPKEVGNLLSRGRLHLEKLVIRLCKDFSAAIVVGI